MNLALINQAQTMSSREIAELTGKEHRNVIRDIRIMLTELHGQEGMLTFEHTYTNEQNGQTYPLFQLPKDETLCLMAGYDVKARMTIIKRWQELEAQQATKLPQTKLEWMQLAVEQEQALIAQQAVIDDQVEKLALAAPSVQFVERYVEAKSSKSLSDVAKVLDWKPREFIKQLSDDKIIFKRGGSWLPYQDNIDNGRFTVTTGESNGHVFNQCRIEPKGVAWLAKKYGK